MNEREIFDIALALTDPKEQASFLDEVCGTDAAQRKRLEEMLDAQRRLGSFLEQPAVPLGPTVDEPVAERPGTVIGPYKLLQEIGHGGMGVVFMAEQSQPVKRRVALKIIKPGMDSRQIIARFEAERQALSLMDHPNIAKVLDAGTTTSGRPYFVMELVKGQPITKYCDEHHMTPRERLELLLPVCQAIQHAHQKGIIHRDIKPSNILVAEYDNKPVPKVIDFGVAKAIHQPLTDKTMFTGFGNIVGTLEYMSPEQAKVNQLDIDTRSDIYSLGVLMYELLTGSTPFDRKRLKQAAWDEMLRIIREEEPPKPSTRLSESADSLPSISAQRHTEPAKLTKMMRGELDWIVMKAMEKDRNRRYETASGFSRDIQRYLANEMVEARPPSSAYRFRKFIQRNRVQVVAATLILLALIGGIIGTSWGLLKARVERDEKELARQAETKQRELAEAAVAAEKAAKLDADAKRQEAERNLAFARKGNQILGSVFAGLDPRKIAESGRPLQDVLRENLAAAVKELEGSAIGDPLEVAAMQNTLGWSLVALGESALAVEVLQKSLATFKARRGPDHAETLTVMCNLGTAYKVGRELDKAVPLYEESLKRLKATLGPDHRWTLTTMNNLGTAYVDSRQLDKAVQLHEEALARRKATLGPDDPDTLQSMCNLATAYQDSRQLDKALPLFKETLSKWKKRDPDHPDTLTAMNNLATAYVDSRQPDKAVPLFEETLEKSKAKLGPSHPDTLVCMGNLTVAYRQSGLLDKAVTLLEEALKKMEAKYSPDHPDTLTTMRALGIAYCEANRGEKAASTFAEFVDRHRKQSPKDNPQFAGLLAQVSLELVRCGQHAAAEPLLRECLGIREKKEPNAWTTFNTQSMLGGSLLSQKKYKDAEPLLLKSYEGMKAREKTIPPQADKRIPETLDRLIQLYTATDRPVEAKKWQAERAKYPNFGPPLREKK